MYGSPALSKTLGIKNLNFASLTTKAAEFHFDQVTSAYNGRKAIFLWLLLYRTVVKKFF